MKITFLFLTGLLLAMKGCNSSGSDVSKDIPSCIAGKIKEIQKEELRNPPAEIWKWEVDNKTYFYITSPCCDQMNFLYDEECQEVCAPDGGFTGQGDGNCPEFKEEIKKTLVWKDERK
ncbi:hypothetical protein AAG747_27775 [Rapidithrix thailandica]|uniref:DUF6970 domain-containing protein n=1 Tax=Rapidithrix thailandica TaxID=413964 RepID=A0AAW9S666_9BACT